MDNNKNEIVSIKQNTIRWVCNIYTSNFVRQFPGNAIVFINSGTSNVRINDIFILLPGASISFGTNQNEVDLTMYKASFIAGGELSIWYKEDSGITINDKYKNVQILQRNMPDKRLTDKKRAKYPRDKDDF